MVRYKEAERLYQQSMEIRCAALGENHPDFATSLNDLALLYHAMRRYEEAEPLYKQAIEIFRSALDEDHDSVTVVLHNFALLRCHMNHLSEAERRLSQVVDRLSPNDEDYVTAQNNLSLVRRLLPTESNDPRVPVLLRELQTITLANVA